MSIKVIAEGNLFLLWKITACSRGWRDGVSLVRMASAWKGTLPPLADISPAGHLHSV